MSKERKDEESRKKERGRKEGRDGGWGRKEKEIMKEIE